MGGTIYRGNAGNYGRGTAGIYRGGGGYRYSPAFTGGYRSGRGYYAPRSVYHFYGYGYHSGFGFARTRYSYIGFGGISYGYYNGCFYRPYGFGLHLIFPPFGICVGSLPYGYYPFYYGSNPYYYYGGVYYSPYSNGGYQVVAPPLGALVPDLPAGATERIIDGEQFFEYNGTFYQKEVRDSGEVWYKVVGVNGRLQTSDAGTDDDYEPVQPQQQPLLPQPGQPQTTQPQTTQPQQPAAPATGDLLFKLPDGCKAVTVNGEQYFEAPNGDYYQEVIGQDNKIMYQLIDKAILQQQPAPAVPNT